MSQRNQRNLLDGKLTPFEIFLYLALALILGELLWFNRLSPQADPEPIVVFQPNPTATPQPDPDDVPFPDLSDGYKGAKDPPGSMDVLLYFGDRAESRRAPVTNALEELVDEGKLNRLTFHYGPYENLRLDSDGISPQFNFPNEARIFPADSFLILAGNSQDTDGATIHTYTIARRFVTTARFTPDEVERICFPIRFTSSAGGSNTYERYADLEVQYITALILVLQGLPLGAEVWLEEGQQTINEIWDQYDNRLAEMREGKLDQVFLPDQALFYALDELHVLNDLLDGRYEEAKNFLAPPKRSVVENTEQRMVFCRQHNMALARHFAGETKAANTAYSGIIDRVQLDSAYRFFPAHYLARYGRALTWIELGEYQKARLDLQEVVILKPAFAETDQFRLVEQYMEEIGFSLDDG